MTETTPAGYAGEGPKNVTVDNKASCADTPYVGKTVKFTNMPLTNLTISVNSQIDGGTASTIVCKNESNGTIINATTGPNGDGSGSVAGLLPGTYTCTIVIDP